MNRFTYILFFIFWIESICSSAQTFRSVNNPPNNLWNDASTWDLGSVPGAGDTVFIRNNDTVNISSNVNVDKITLRGNGELNVSSGSTLSVLQNINIQAQNDNGNTTSFLVDGVISLGNNLAIKNRSKINYTLQISGGGSISVANNMTILSDTNGSKVIIATPISVGNNCTFTASKAAGELNINLSSSISTVKNFTLSTNNGADSTKNLFDMRFSGASLSVGNSFNLSGGGGFLLNSAAVSSDVYFTTFSKLKISNQLFYNNIHLTTTSNVNANKDLSTILGNFIIDNGCTINTNKKTWKMAAGNLVVNGSIISSGGDDSLIFTGNSAQSISGSGNATIENLVIQNSSGVSNSLNIDIIKMLKLETGTFSTGGNITLKSTNSRTAYIPEIGNNGVGAAISGNVTCERNITGVNTIGYRNLSSPVQSTTISDFQNGTSPIGIYTYGFTGSNQPSASGYVSNYQYNPALANASGIKDDGWVVATNSTNQITPHKAWAFYMGGTAGSGSKTTYDLSTTGNIYSGAITLNSSNGNIAANSGLTQEWGLIGNPYPSALQWSSVSKTNVSSIAQVYGEDDYNGYRTTNFNAAANRIAPFQAFWVQTIGSSPSLTFEENDKITNNISFRKSAQFENRLYLEVVDKTNNYSVHACVEFNSQASELYDPNLDGLVFKNPWPYPNVYFPIQDSLNGQVYSTNSNYEQIIPLKIYAAKGKAGNVNLKFNQLPELKACIRLEDRKLGKSITIDSNMVYSFILSENENENRFFIHYVPGLSEFQSHNLTCNRTNDGKIVFIASPQLFTPILYFENSTMIKLFKDKHNYYASNLLPGKYKLNLTGKNSCKNLFYPITIFEPLEVISEFKHTFKTYGLNENIDLKNTSQAATNFDWYFSDSTTSKQYEPYKSFNTVGNYNIKLVAGNGNKPCNDTSISSVKIVSTPTAISNENKSISNAFRLATKTDGYYLIYDLNTPKFVRLKLIDMNGKVYSSRQLQINQRKTKIQTPSESGIYILQISTNEGEQYFKLIQN